MRVWVYGEGKDTNASSRSFCVLDEDAADVEAMIC
jgi:hypothetical protein